MPLNSYDIEQLEKYISGKLSKEESDALVRKLVHDTELTEALHDLRLVKNLVELRQEERMTEMLQDIYQNTPYDLTSFFKIHLKKIAGALLFVSVFCLLIILIRIPGSSREEKTDSGNSATPQINSTIKESSTILPAQRIPVSIKKKTEKRTTDSVMNQHSFLFSTPLQNATQEDISENVEDRLPVFVPDKKGAPDCGEVQWPAIEISPACSDEANGSLRLSNANAIQWALHDSSHYSTNVTFEQLEPGKHAVYMKHQNGCIKFQVATVGIKECVGAIKASFAPDAGERWEIPFKKSGNEKTIIRDLSGKIVFETASENSWNGTDLNGNVLPTAVYHVNIESSGKVIASGTVTILK